MGTPRVRADYEQLAQIAKIFEAQANASQTTFQRIQGQKSVLQGGDWLGRGAQAFYTEMERDVLPAVRRLINALQRAGQVTLTMSQVMKQAEMEAARVFRLEEQGGATPTDGSSPTDKQPSLWEKTLAIAKNIVDAVDTFFDVAPIPAALAFLLGKGLTLGSTYAGQIIVKVPEFLKAFVSAPTFKNFIGLAENLTHIKAANFAQHIASGALKMGPIDWIISGAKGVVGIADTWTNHWDEYATYNMPKRITAMTVDAALALAPVATEQLGGMGGMWLGAKAGAAIGTFVGGPIGTAAGAVIGGVVGGFAGDWLGGKLGEWGVNAATGAGMRDAMVNTIDSYIAQPIASGIQKASDALSTLGSLLPSVRFGF